MIRAKRFISIAVALFAFIVFVLAFAACTKQQQTTDGDYEFVFTGSGVFSDGNEYNVTITGNKDKDKTFDLRVEEMPALELDGTWVYVENKGYKLYFNDSGGSFVYSKYDTQSKEFSFKYSLNLGGGLGQTKVTMTCLDEKFSSVYDGVGLPPIPPTFTGYGWGGAKGVNKYTCTLICNEDGTCVSITDTAGIDPRYGTWEYNEETNVYSFEFEEEVYPSNYIRPRPEDNKQSYLHGYGVLKDLEEGHTEYVQYMPVEDFDEQPQFTTSTWYYDENGNKVETPFETTYDEETKTYTLIYEAMAKRFLDRIVTYTLED